MPMGRAHIYIHQVGAATRGIVGRWHLRLQTYPATAYRPVAIISKYSDMRAISQSATIILLIGLTQRMVRHCPEHSLEHLDSPRHQLLQITNICLSYIHLKMLLSGRTLIHHKHLMTLMLGFPFGVRGISARRTNDSGIIYDGRNCAILRLRADRLNRLLRGT